MEVTEERQISDKKIQQNEVVQGNVIKSRIKKHTKELSNDLKYNALLVGDSKVRHIQQLMTAQTNLSAFWRSGSTLNNRCLKQYIDQHISRFNRPIVILLFNTCYLTYVTDKERKFIDLVPNSDDVVNSTIESYRAFKQQRLYNKPAAQIMFIECPFYSIVEWNQRMRHPEPDSFQANQDRLEKMIIELNSKIKELNAPQSPPQIAQDMIVKIKKKANHTQTRRINYTLLKDGIHPGKDLSQLWLVRINNFVSALNK